MPYEFLSLVEALSDLPTLRKVLGPRWIDRESNTLPLESAFPLARTLRIKELSHLHATLDRRLSDFGTVTGAEDWRNRLRSDGQGFRELQTELAFADLLQQHGYTFQHPDKGPDFSIDIGDGQPLMVEATTPRVIAWDDDLGTRLWVLSRQFEHSIRTEPLGDDLPILSEDVTERKVQRIVADAIELLSSASGDGSVIGQTYPYPDIGLKIEWTPSANPMFSGRNAPASSHGSAFNYVWTAVENKVKQLRSVDAHTLLIGTNQLPMSDWGPYVQSVRQKVPYYGDFDWTQIHPQIDRIILFEATYGDNRLPAVDVVTRPSASADVAAGLGRFLEELRLAGEDYRRQSQEDERELVAQLMEHEARKRQTQASS
jgi:hypothetical protein